ncbi:MAG: aromatic ring-hydroxylating dioxygenase subunit alpha [Candidatus Rokuibacteriota bacterium]|nr:MAG: aromatic ring-hydroxylating dioxygenase subunit alpha [Candidatus Rokubacteria bacterium]
MAGFESSSVERLVDAKGGTISREIFVNETIYRQEQEQIFSRAWLFVGHESQIARPGDFAVSSMGEESVILCRDRGGHIHVFLNSCRHRGMKVCRYDEGNTVEFLCPYHGWSYSTDGQLVGVPYLENSDGGELDTSRWGLIEVAQLENYKGMIFATWDRSAPSFLEYLGGYKLYFDLLVDAWDGREGGTEVIGGIHKWLIPCNWKFPAENFSGDRYHGVSHRSVDMVGLGPSGQGRRDMGERNQSRWLDVSFPDRGHSMIAFLRPHDAPISPSYENAPEVAEYFRRCEEERRRRLGAHWRLFGGPGTMFPNASPLARQPRTIALWNPRGPHQTECWRWYLVDADAPAPVKNFLRQYYTRYSGPSGLTEQDDMENWNYAHAASRGTIARQYPYNYEMGLGRATQSFEDHGLALPGVICDVTNANASESNQRGFYGRWSQFMEAQSWTELMPP